MESLPHNSQGSSIVIFLKFLICSGVFCLLLDAEETTQRLHPPVRQSASCEISPSTGEKQ